MARKNTKKGNKYLNAGLGAIASFQAAVEENFEKFVAKGEVARKGYLDSIARTRAEVEKDVAQQVDEVKNRVVSLYDSRAPVKIDEVLKRADNVRYSVTQSASKFLNLPTAKDIDALNKKLDKVIRKVAA